MRRYSWKLEPPFSYFGGKRYIAEHVWNAFGTVENYVEPFFGSGAVLLARPGWEPNVRWKETINDKDGFVSNFWRAVKNDPEQVAFHADWPANENDFHARHYYLVSQKESMRPKLEGDPEWYDAKIAGWWVWGMSLWIGGGFCDGKGPWRAVNGELVNTNHQGETSADYGVQRRMIHAHRPMGIFKKTLSGHATIADWMNALAERMRYVSVCCGDWSRVCGPTPTIHSGLTAVFLDPPYSEESGRAKYIYAEEDYDVAHEVRKWCMEWGDHHLMRIALCGYYGEHNELEERGWRIYRWTAQGGYSNWSGRGTYLNRYRECVWFSPHCNDMQSQKRLDIDSVYRDS